MMLKNDVLVCLVVSVLVYLFVYLSGGDGACQSWSLADATEQTAEWQPIVLQVGIRNRAYECVCVYHNSIKIRRQQSPCCLVISSHPFPAWHHQTAALPSQTHTRLAVTCMRLPSPVYVSDCVAACGHMLCRGGAAPVSCVLTRSSFHKAAQVPVPQTWTHTHTMNN